MQNEYENLKAPISSLRAERPQASNQTPGLGDSGHIKGVEATSSGLIRATLGAALAASVILTVVWLPAEYGIDPTGIGEAIGLTEMGDIKQQLYAEAAADDAAAWAATSSTVNPALLAQLDRIETQMMAIVAIIGDGTKVATSRPAEPVVGPASNVVKEAAADTSAWRDEVSYTLAPGEGIEVKLVMEKGDVATFEWTANGALLNFDTHGDGGGQNISYDQGRGVSAQQDILTAAFSGNHGWFWRNRTDAPVTFTLRTRGEYSEMKSP